MSLEHRPHESPDDGTAILSPHPGPLPPPLLPGTDAAASLRLTAPAFDFAALYRFNVERLWRLGNISTLRRLKVVMPVLALLVSTTALSVSLYTFQTQLATTN